MFYHLAFTKFYLRLRNEIKFLFKYYYLLILFFLFLSILSYINIYFVLVENMFVT